MKKHIYIAFLFCIVSLTGCDNFLTVESPDFSTDKFWGALLTWNPDCRLLMGSWITEPVVVILLK